MFTGLGTATSTFAGGVSAAGLNSSAGLTVTGASYLATGSGTHVGIGTTTMRSKKFYVEGQSVFEFDSNGTNPVGSANYQFSIYQPNATNNNVIGMTMDSKDSAGNIHNFGGIGFVLTDHTDGTETSDFIINSRNAGTYAEKIRIKGNGNFGIGLNNPQTILDIAATSTDTGWGNQVNLRSFRAAIVSGNLLGGLTFTSNDTTLTAPGTTTAAIQALANATHTASELGTDIVFKSTTGTTYAELMRLTGAGKLGLGTSTPSDTLEVSVVAGSNPTIVLSDGDVSHPFTTLKTNTNLFGEFGIVGSGSGGLFVKGLSDTDAISLAFRGLMGTTDPTDTIPAVQFRAGKLSGTTGAALGSLETAYQFLDWNASTAYLTILGSGNLGIGTSTPDRRLTVSGGAGVVMTSLDNGAGTAYVCTTLASGALSTSTSACNPSSRRFKNNIENLNTGLEDLMKLRPVSFTYKPEMLIGEQNQVGFIAEEIVEIVPESVGFDKQGLPYNVDYSKLTPLLTKAVQELNAKVDLLSDRQGSAPRRQSNSSVTINSSSTPATLDTSFMEEIVAFLNTLYDVVIERGLLRVVHLVSEKITTEELTATKSLEIGTEENPIGFVMYDETNGKPYCITIKKGDFVKTKGLCGEIDESSNESHTGGGGSVDEPVITGESNQEAAVSDEKESISLDTPEESINDFVPELVSESIAESEPSPELEI